VLAALFLAWGAHQFRLDRLRAQRLLRIGLLAALLAGAALSISPYWPPWAASRSFMRR
jgi:putative peptidoglycan lipid II flippase